MNLHARAAFVADQIGIVQRSTLVPSLVERLDAAKHSVRAIVAEVTRLTVWRNRWKATAKYYRDGQRAWMVAYDRVERCSADARAEVDALRRYAENLEAANAKLLAEREPTRANLGEVGAELVDARVEINRLRARVEELNAALREQTERADGNAEALIASTESANVWRDRAAEWQAEALRLRAVVERESGTRLATGTH